ncbi:talin rod domain-containing protein 1-like [Mustelus asterias]
MDCGGWEGALDGPVAYNESRLVYISDSCKRKIQHVSDLLLSCEARPVDAKSLSACGESFEKCRDTIIARTKGLAILVHELQCLAPVSREAEVGHGLVELCNLVVALVECSSHAGYLAALEVPGSRPARPGPVEQYRVSVLEQEVEQHCRGLRSLPLGELSPALLSDVAQGVSRALRGLAHCCRPPAEAARDPFAREQFRLGLRGASCCARALLSCLRELRAAPSERARARCVVFGGPLLHSVRALVGLATEPQFLGRPAVLPSEARAVHASILEGARRVASSCLLFVQWIRDVSLLTAGGTPVPTFRERMKTLAGGVSDSCHLLSQVLRDNDTLTIFNASPAN